MMKWLIGLLAVALTVAWTVQAFTDGRTWAGWGGVAASVVLVALVAVWAVLARGNRKRCGAPKIDRPYLDEGSAMEQLSGTCNRRNRHLGRHEFTPSWGRADGDKR